MLSRVLPQMILAVLALSLAGCASYYQPRYGHDGVYYDDPYAYSRTSIHVGYHDPLLYPYWSLDYFYFSRYYHPYSVRIHYYDPWYYPYPGWYYGYRPGPRSHVGLAWGSYYYPWFAYGSHYHYYRPWRPQYVSYPRQAAVEAPQIDRVRLIDDRLRHVERRERAAMARTREEIGSGESRPITAQRGIERSRSAGPGDARVLRQRSEGIPTRPIPRRQQPEQTRQQTTVREPARPERGAISPRQPQRSQAEPPPRRESSPQPPPRRSQPVQRSSSSSESAPPRRQERSSPPPRRSSSSQRERSSEPRRSRSQRREPPASEPENRSRQRN